jgi:hypothetical protein
MNSFIGLVVSLCVAFFAISASASRVDHSTGQVFKSKPSTQAAQNTSTYSEILDTCYDFLESHLCSGHKWGKPFHFYRPSLEKYSPDQWLWDSGSHMIVWSHRNVTNSILDLRTMLSMQREDGRIPEEIFWGPRTLKQDLQLLLQYSNTQFTDTTQMPVLPYSLRSIYEQSGKNKALLKEFLYPLVNYFKWWRAERDFGDGLVTVIHNWESGLDASPAYDPAFHVYVTELNQSSFLQVYSKFEEIVESYRFLYKWNVTEILGREKAPERPEHIDTWFKVKDLGVNSVYASGWYVLGKLAHELLDFETEKYCNEQYHLTADAIVNKMWREDQKHFNTLYIDFDGVEKSSVANSVQNLFPLLLKDLPQKYVDLIVSQIEDSNKFNAPFMIPTVAMDDPQFSATFDVDLMWRGPVWGFTNWFVMEGLELHGRADLQVRNDSSMLLKMFLINTSPFTYSATSLTNGLV